MTEIKSTLEMVLARAEVLCADAPDLPDDTHLNEGMKFAASFIGDDSVDISQKLSTLAVEVGPIFVQGMLRTFNRFIALPRDDSKAWQDALHGIHDLGAVFLPSFPPELANILSELGSLLGRYKDHRNQLKSQLKEQFAMQTAQLAESMAQKTGTKMNITPEQHPKFNEEWVKVTDQLNGQYNNALDQYKASITPFFTISD